MDKIILFGSTGSIGTQTIKVLKEQNDLNKVVGVSFNSNIKEITNQIKVLKKLQFVYCPNQENISKLQPKFPKLKFISDLKELNKFKADLFINAITSFEGVKVSYEAIKLYKNIAIANKESFVCCGELLTKLAIKHKTTLVPIDSEHTSLKTLLNEYKWSNIKNVYITCSGGPFRTKTFKELKTVNLTSALKHPNWKMGSKITIDSATLMNKVFEIVETYHLYKHLKIKNEQINVLLHPQSIVHAAIELKDESMIMNASLPNMILPIQQVLYGKTLNTKLVKPIKDTDLKKITFEEFNDWQNKMLNIGYAIIDNPYLGLKMNVVNDLMVQKLLNKKIEFIDLINFIFRYFDKHKLQKKTINNIDTFYSEIGKITREINV